MIIGASYPLASGTTLQRREYRKIGILSTGTYRNLQPKWVLIFEGISKFTSVCMGQVSFHVGCPFLYGACEHYVVVVIKMVSKFMDAYFLWVPIYMYVCIRY